MLQEVGAAVACNIDIGAGIMLMISAGKSGQSDGADCAGDPGQ